MMASSRIPGFGLGVAACLAAMLALAGCGGSSSTKPPDPPDPPDPSETPAQLAAAAVTALDAAEAAVDKVTDGSGDATVTDADAKVRAAETAVAAASGAENHGALSERLGGLKASLAARKKSRTAAIAVRSNAQTDLKVARDAAAAAAKVARDAATAAATDADEAEAAVAGLLIFQTGTDGNPAEARVAAARAARAAAQAATTASGTARSESAKAAAATTLTVAVEARVAAEAARRAAETQAATAMEKAKVAADRGDVALEVSSDGKTFSVGDHSIKVVPEPSPVTPAGGAVSAGSALTTTTRLVNGKTVTTRTGHWSWAWQATAAVPARTAGAGQKAAPGIAGRNGKHISPLLGPDFINTTDKDGHRLQLRTHYVGTKTVHAWRNITSGTGDQRTGTGATVDHDGNSGTAQVAVLKAEGEFYGTDGTGAFDDNAKISGATIQAVPADPDLWYYRVGAVKHWLRRVKTETNAQGQTTYTYKPVSVVADVGGFPAAVPYEHMNYGVWAERKNGAEADSLSGNAAIGFVRLLPDGEGMTPVSDIPKFGTATYNGHWLGRVRKRHAQGNGEVNRQYDTASVTADFGKGSVTVDLRFLATLQGTIDGSGFKGTEVTKVTDISTLAHIYGSSPDDFTGEFSGAFFGPKAPEVGGVFDFTSEGRKAGEFKGAFGGRRTGE